MLVTHIEGVEGHDRRIAGRLVVQGRSWLPAGAPWRDTGGSSGLEGQESSGVSRLFVMFGFDVLPLLRVVIATLQFLAALLGLRQA